MLPKYLRLDARTHGKARVRVLGIDITVSAIIRSKLHTGKFRNKSLNAKIVFLNKYDFMPVALLFLLFQHNHDSFLLRFFICP